MKTNSQLLGLDFYNRSTLVVARELLGCDIWFRNNDILFSGRIVETEAYIGMDDPACHAAVGKTARNAVMFGPAGISYVYFIYGMYNCLNVVTEADGFPAAVLIRAIEPIKGVGEMQRNRNKTRLRDLGSGPGKLCQALGITREHSGLDLSGKKIWLTTGSAPTNIVETTRIGISVGKEKPWRFYDADSIHVSKKDRFAERSPDAS